MANTFGQSKEDDTSAQLKVKEMSPTENCAANDKAKKGSDNPDENTWRPTDQPLESVTDPEFDETQEKDRNKKIHSDSPGLQPDIAK